MKTTRVALCLIVVSVLDSFALAQSVSKVSVISPERKTIRQIVEQPASLEAWESTPIYARVAGYIERVTVDIGDQVVGPQYGPGETLVKPGQTLAVLSLPELVQEIKQKQASIVEAQAQVDQAYAAVRVSESKVVSARTQVAAAEAGIRRVSASLERQRSELDRLTQLASRQAISQKAVDESREAWNGAQASHDEATAQLEATHAQIKEAEAFVAKARADRAAADARVKVAEASLAQTQTMLDYGTLRAPFAGVVSKRGVHTGHFVQAAGAGAPLFEITRLDTIRVFIDVPEAFAALIDKGDPVDVRFPSAPVPSIHSQIARMSWTLDKSSRTLKAEVDVPNPEGKLRPGMYAYASIVAAEKKEALVLPASALILEKTQVFCACVEDRKVVRKEIKLGLRTATEVEVIEGLQGPEQVIRANAANLTVGQTVEMVTPAGVNVKK